MEESDRIAVAASRALQQISSSAHARSLPSTPRPPPTACSEQQQQQQHDSCKDEILDIFMSPDKPKSRLRQRAENSAKKFNPKKPIQTDNPQNNLTEHFVLNLGIPNKPTPDPKALADYKPPTRRSIGPRRSSVVSKRASSPTKSPKPPIEVLLDDLDILDRSRATKSPFDLKKPAPKSTPKTRSNPTKKSSTSRSNDPPITRKTRRLTTHDISSDQDHHNTKEAIPKTSIPNMDSDSYLADQDPPANHESDCSSDSFDANILVVHQPKAEELAQEESIIINPLRPPTRTRAGMKPKRVIADSEEEEEGEANEDSRSLGSTSFSSSKSPRSSTNKAPAPRRSQRKSSIRASHSQQKSSAADEIIDVESDDSIEINPSRALQFQKLRSQALTTGSYSTSCDPLNGSISQKSRQNPDAVSLQNNRRLVISSDESSSGEEDIQLKQQDKPSESSPKPIPGNRRSHVISSDDDEEEIQIKSNDNRTKPSPKPILANRRRQVISSDESGDDPIQIKSKDDKSSPKPISGNRQRQVISSDESSSGEEEIQIKVKDSRPKSSPKPVSATEGDKPKAKAGEGGGPSKSRGTATRKPTKSTAKTLTQKDLASLPFVEVREEMAEDLLVELNKKVFGRKLPPIELFWSKRLNTTAGRAHYVHVKDAFGNHVPRARVELAYKVVDDIHKLRSTLAHELCHVACWFIDRKMRENHGRFFQAWGRKVHKAMPDIVVTTRHSYEISYKFKWACDRTGCNRVFGRHSDSIKPVRQRCGCGGRLVAILRNGKEVVAPATPSSTTTPSSPPESSVELLIDLDSPDECTDHEARPGRRSSDTPSPPSTTTSTSVSTPNPYLTELEEIDPVRFLNPYLQALVLFDPVPFHPNTRLIHRPPPPPPVAASAHHTVGSDLLLD